MKLCDDGHEEIVHQSKDCPACVFMVALDKAQETIKELENDLKYANDQIELLESK